jgi:hypothetical protein
MNEKYGRNIEMQVGIITTYFENVCLTCFNKDVFDAKYERFQFGITVSVKNLYMKIHAVSHTELGVNVNFPS